MADGYLLAPETYEEGKTLLPRGVIVTNTERHGGATRYFIRGADIVDGMGYQMVSTDGPLLRCIELVEYPIPEDGSAVGETQPRLKPQ